MLTYSSVGEHLSCLHFLAIISNITMNICGQVSVWTNVFSSLRNILRRETVGSYGYYKINILRNCHPSFPSSWVHHFTFLATMYDSTNFSTLLSTCVIIPCFNSCPSSAGEVVSHCGFDLHFCSDWWCWVYFHIPFVYLVWRNVSSNLLPTF